MPRPFLEERINELPRIGTDFDESHAVVNTSTAGGNSYGHALNPYPTLSYRLKFNNSTRDFTREYIVDLYHRSNGTLGGFRAKHHLDYSTNNYVGTPTATDQICIYDASQGGYQMIRWYGTQGDLTQARRRILKPVSGTGLVSIDDQQITTDFTIDYTTGIIAFTDNADTVESISNASQAVIGLTGHGYEVGDWVYIASVTMASWVDGRYEVVGVNANDITIDLNTSGMGAYSSGGTVNTAPQSGEVVKSGCYFDIPMRFERDLSGISFSDAVHMDVDVDLVEILNV